MSLGAHGFYTALSGAVAVGACMLMLASCGEKTVSVKVSNHNGNEIGTRCVELPADEILKRLGSAGFYIVDADGNEIPSQLSYDGYVLFMADVPAGESRRFTLHPCDSVRTYPVTVAGAFYPERRDDVSYENELVGFRIYGPGTQQAGERSFGYDLFLKHPADDLIVPQLYAPETDPETWRKVDSLRAISPELAEDFIKSFSYHIDHGLGMDCYAVGPTLGAGVAALMAGDSICYPWCYEKGRILDNGPLRFTVALDFAPMPYGDSASVTEHRLISLDSGSHLNRCEVWYDGLAKAAPVAVGFPLRDESDVISDTPRGVMAYADPTQGPDNGKAMVGIVLENRTDSVFEKDDHSLMSATLVPGDTLRYKWGFAWDRTDISSLDSWKDYLDRAVLGYSVTME